MCAADLYFSGLHFIPLYMYTLLYVFTLILIVMWVVSNLR